MSTQPLRKRDKISDTLIPQCTGLTNKTKYINIAIIAMNVVVIALIVTALIYNNMASPTAETDRTKRKNIIMGVLIAAVVIGSISSILNVWNLALSNKLASCADEIKSEAANDQMPLRGGR
jgi:hypothetical protein